MIDAYLGRGALIAPGSGITFHDRESGMSAIEARETRLHLTTGAWAWIAVIAALLLVVAASMAGMVDPKSVPYLVFIDPFVQMARRRISSSRRSGKGWSRACSTR